MNNTRRSSSRSLADVEAVFEALAHESRRHILLLLSHRGGELPSGYLAARFSHSWPTTCRHLKVLEDAGLVSVRREGRGSWYRLDRDRLQGVVGAWLTHLALSARGQRWASSGPKSTHHLTHAGKHTTEENGQRS